MYWRLPEDKDPAERKRLAAEDGKKEVKVVFWTYMGQDTRAEFIQAAWNTPSNGSPVSSWTTKRERSESWTIDSPLTAIAYRP